MNSRPQTLTPLDAVQPLNPEVRAAGPVVGIDLGFSSVRVGTVKAGQPEVITSARRRWIPALVAAGPDGRIVVGRNAQNQRLVEGAEWLAGARALLSGDPGAVQQARNQSSATLEDLPSGLPQVRFTMRPYSAVDLVAMLLVEARNWAQEVLLQPVQRAVITVPPGRTATSVEALRAAAARAGLLLERPVTTVAAAILGTLRGSKDTRERLVLVWDWGCSGLELTLASASPSQVSVRGTACYRELSGFTVDHNLLREVLETWPEDQARLENEPAVAKARLAAGLEVAKLQLGEREEVRVQLPFLYTGGSIPRGFDHTLKRDALFRAMAPNVRRAFDACGAFLAAHGVTPQQLGEVIFCGGQCEVAALEPRFRAYFPVSQLHLKSPSERAVLGAALAAQRVELGMAAPR